MPDYGNELEFGVFVTPDATKLPEITALAQLGDAGGLDIFTVQDHPYQQGFFDAWTLLAVLGAQTNHIRLSANVTNLPLRPPVVLAKSAATLDIATGGRVEMGLGAGAFWDAVVAAGGPRRSPGEAVDALTEAIDLMRAFWSGGTLRFEGEHYSAKGLHAGPTPVHDIPIWIGAIKPRMLRLVGRQADAWIPSATWAPPSALPEMNGVIDDAAHKAGRDPRTIRRMYNVSGSFTRGDRDTLLVGSPKDWADQLVDITLEHGMSSFILSTDDADVLARWTQEVAPLARELVATERAGRSTRRDVAPTVIDPVPADRVPLLVQPTPDDGTRLVSEQPWDESTRPQYTPTDNTYELRMQGNSQHLVDIHDHLRTELDQIRDVLDQVRRGNIGVGSARSVINTMTMRQNNWTLGAYCESYCRVVTGHHTLEDRSVFPHLRRTIPELAPVLNRLEEEHVVIHDVLDAFDRALVALVGVEINGSVAQSALDDVQHQLDLLTDTLLSHLAYEERELLGPLARVGFQ